MVGFEILIRVTREKRQEFMQACEMLFKTKSRDPACKSQTLYEASVETNIFLWVEHWSEPVSMDNHLASKEFRMLLGAIDVLGELEAFQKMQIEHIKQ